MFETAAELAWLDDLLTRSLRGASEHLRARPGVSVAHIVGDDLGIFCHGQAEFLGPDHPERPAIEEHLTAHYGSSPSSWGPDIVYLRVQPHWMVSYAFAKDRLLGETS